jgi:hypothetical protein
LTAYANGREFITHVRSLGGEVALAGDGEIRVTPPDGLAGDEIQDAGEAYKVEILAQLERERDAIAFDADDGWTPPDMGWRYPLPAGAYHGVLGDLTRKITAQSESDPAAILGNLLAMTGSAIGRGAVLRTGDERHHTNLYIAIVGATSSGAKGMAANSAAAVMARADADWYAGCRVGGLSSGEGLLTRLRDSDENRDKRLG